MGKEDFNKQNDLSKLDQYINDSEKKKSQEEALENSQEKAAEDAVKTIEATEETIKVEINSENTSDDKKEKLINIREGLDETKNFISDPYNREAQADKLITAIFPDVKPGGVRNIENLKDLSKEELAGIMEDTENEADYNFVKSFLNKKIEEESTSSTKEAQGSKQEKMSQEEMDAVKTRIKSEQLDIRRAGRKTAVGLARMEERAAAAIVQGDEFSVDDAAKGIEDILDNKEDLNEQGEAMDSWINRSEGNEEAKVTKEGFEGQDSTDKSIKEARKKAAQEKASEEVPEENEHLEKIRSTFASLDSLRKDPFATPSMLAREESKIRSYIREGKIDGLEARVIEAELNKKPFDKNSLGNFMGRVAKMREKVAGEKTWYGKYVQWVNDGGEGSKNKQAGVKFAKRLAGSLVIGTGVAGVLGLAGFGAGVAGFAAIGAKLGFNGARMLASMGSAALAGEIHKQATKKGLEKKIADLKEIRREDMQSRRTQLEEQGDRLTAEELAEMRSIRALGEEKTEEQVARLKELDDKYESYQEKRTRGNDRGRDNLNILRDKLLEKNEKNRNIVSGVAAAAVGLGAGLSGLNPGFSGAAGVEDADLDKPPVTEDKPSVTEDKPDVKEGTKEGFDYKNYKPSESDFIQKGEGITHSYLRQLRESAELREALGITGTPTGADAARLAAEHGYIDGVRDVRVYDGHDAAYSLEIIDGKVEVIESHGGRVNFCSNEIENAKFKESHGLGSAFEKNTEFYEYHGDNTPKPKVVERVEVKPLTTAVPKFDVTPIEKPDFTPLEVTETKPDFTPIETVETTPVEEKVVYVEKEPELSEKEIRRQERLERRRLRHLRKMERIKRGGGGGLWKLLTGVGAGYIIRDVIEDNSGGGTTVSTTPTTTNTGGGYNQGSSSVNRSGGYGSGSAFRRR